MIQVARVLAEVRRILQDSHPDQPRDNDAAVRAAMAMALQDMRRMRPDVFLGMLSAVPDLADQSVTQVDIEAMFITPLVMITASHLLMQNDEYNRDGSSANLLALGRTQLVGLA